MVATFTFALVVGNVTDLVLDMSSSTKEYKKRITLLNSYLSERRMPQPTRRRLRVFFSNYYKKKSVYEDFETEMMKNLPYDGYREIHDCLLRPFAEKFELFDVYKDDDDFIKLMFMSLHP